MEFIGCPGPMGQQHQPASRFTPVAITTAIDSTRSSTRTFSYSASTHHVADQAAVSLGDDFKPQVMTRPNKTSQPREQTQDKPKHDSVLITRLEDALLVDPPDGVLATYKTAS
jgi:hypothetical protein